MNAPSFASPASATASDLQIAEVADPGRRPRRFRGAPQTDDAVAVSPQTLATRG